MVWRAVVNKPNTCGHVCHTPREMKEWHYSIHVRWYRAWPSLDLCGKQLNWCEDQLNRFLVLHVLVEGLGICWATFGLKVPILLNWVKLRPGIWDGGAISSTGWGAVCDKAPTQGCLGLAPSRGSKQCGMDILPIFRLRFGSNLLMCMASLTSLVIWEGSLSIMLKSEMEGNGWWKSLQCLSMAEVVDLECSLTLSPRALEVSLM